MAFSRTINNLAGQFAAWIADIHSITLYGRGVAINKADFPNGLPSGSLVTVTAGVAKPWTTGSAAYLTRIDYVPDSNFGSTDTVALVTGGNIYGDKLPVKLTAEQITALGVRFHITDFEA